MAPQVRFDRIEDLSAADRAASRALATAVYPPAEWADWPGYQIEWSDMRWCMRVFEAEWLVSYLAVETRAATHDGRPVQVGGIGGVKTHPKARRRGYAALAFERAAQFFASEARVDFALLVCDPKLIDYYGKLGWREFAGRLMVRQRGELAEFTFNRVLVRDVLQTAPTTGVIDLGGPPW